MVWLQTTRSQGWFTFETACGSCEGSGQLVKVSGLSWFLTSVGTSFGSVPAYEVAHFKAFARRSSFTEMWSHLLRKCGLGNVLIEDCRHCRKSAPPVEVPGLLEAPNRLM